MRNILERLPRVEKRGGPSSKEALLSPGLLLHPYRSKKKVWLNDERLGTVLPRTTILSLLAIRGLKRALGRVQEESKSLQKKRENLFPYRDAKIRPYLQPRGKIVAGGVERGKPLLAKLKPQLFIA